MNTLEEFEKQFPRFSEVWEAAKARPDYNRARFHAAVYLIFTRKMTKIGRAVGKIPPELSDTIIRGLEGVAALLMEPEITGPGGEFQGSLFSTLEKCISSDFTDLIKSKGPQS